MKKPLFAYQTKLQWQLCRLGQQSSALLQDLLRLEQQLEACQTLKSGYRAPNSRLLPETEIASFAFRQGTEESKSVLTKKKQALLAQKASLERQTLAVTMELERIEKYQIKVHIKKRAAEGRKTQAHLDVWALLKHSKDLQ